MKITIAEFDNYIDLELYAENQAEEKGLALLRQKAGQMISAKSMRSPYNWKNSGIRLAFGKAGRPKGTFP